MCDIQFVTPEECNEARNVLKGGIEKFLKEDDPSFILEEASQMLDSG